MCVCVRERERIDMEKGIKCRNTRIGGRGGGDVVLVKIPVFFSKILIIFIFRVEGGARVTL